MNKKAMALKTIIVMSLIMVVTLVFIVSFFSSEGLMNTVAGEANKLLGRYMPDRPKPQLSASQVAENERITEVYFTLNDAFLDAKDSPDIGCWVPFTEIPNDLNVWRLEIDQRTYGTRMKLVATVYGGTEGTDETTEHNNDINDINLCVLEGDSARTFFNKLENNPTNMGGEFKQVSSIKIVEEGFSYDPKIFVDGRKHDFQYSDILYKPTADRVCLIPVHDFGYTYGCDADTGTLDDDCIDDIKDKIKECRVI